MGTTCESIPVSCQVQVRRSDVMSAWSGIRPLASDPDAQDTAGASRDHVVSMDTDGMITIAGLAIAQQQNCVCFHDLWLRHTCNCISCF